MYSDSIINVLKLHAIHADSVMEKLYMFALELLVLYMCHS